MKLERFLKKLHSGGMGASERITGVGKLKK
jgi:hypothetical protein